MSNYYNNGINSHSNSAAIAASNDAAAASAAAATANYQAALAYEVAEAAEERAYSARRDMEAQKSLNQDKISELWGEFEKVYGIISKVHNFMFSEYHKTHRNEVEISEINGKITTLQHVLADVSVKVDSAQEIQDVVLDMVVSLQTSLLALAEKEAPEIARKMKELSGVSAEIRENRIKEDEEMASLEKLLPKNTKAFKEAALDIWAGFVTLRKMILEYFEPVDGEEKFRPKGNVEDNLNFIAEIKKKGERERTKDEGSFFVAEQASTRKHMNISEDAYKIFLEENEDARALVEDFRVWDCADTDFAPSLVPHVVRAADLLIASESVSEDVPVSAMS